MLATAILLPKLKITSIFGVLIMVVALALVNSKVWDAALFFSIPNSFTTKAAVILISNGVIFWVLVKLLPGIEVEGFLTALVAPIIFSLSSIFISQYLSNVDWSKVLDYTLKFFETVKGQISQISST